MRNAGLEEAHTGIKIAGRNINNLRYADDTTLMAESEGELKSLYIKNKQKTAYEMPMCDWSSDVCSSDLRWAGRNTSWNQDCREKSQ